MHHFAFFILVLYFKVSTMDSDFSVQTLITLAFSGGVFKI